MILGLLWPVVYTLWVSFSPSSYLTLPTSEWSLEWYRSFASNDRWKLATVNSFFIATATAFGALGLATSASAALQALPRVIARFAFAFLMLPAGIPVAAQAAGLLPLVFHIGLWDSKLGLILAHTSTTLPVALLIIHNSWIRQTGLYQEVAAGLGANALQSFRAVTLPLLMPAFTTSAITVFIISLNESILSLFLSTAENATLPAVIWPELQFAVSPLVAAASTLTTAIGVISFLIIWRLSRMRSVGLATPTTDSVQTSYNQDSRS